ncbi:YT521-B-like domain-containing protein, partial [Mycena amicta]
PMVRQPYHPDPPAHRSEWVMWVGNVPSDAGHDELWRFFTRPPITSWAEGLKSTVAAIVPEVNGPGVFSIFLISRSNCAFVNYETKEHLQRAVSRFNGVPLRLDGRCPRLVCRMRVQTDDLKAGVGGQRGMSIHKRWVQAKADMERTADDSSTGSATCESTATPSSNSDDHDKGRGRRVERVTPALCPRGSNSSSSNASTESSLLRQYFPQRYFIVKSLTQDDLDSSVQRGLWATQKHNEGVLDRAFRTSKDVFLIFSVNKSGEFYGYGRMTSPIGPPRDAVTSARGNSASPTIAGKLEPAHLRQDIYQQPPNCNPARTQARDGEGKKEAHSAPAMLQHLHKTLSAVEPVLLSVVEPVLPYVSPYLCIPAALLPATEDDKSDTASTSNLDKWDKNTKPYEGGEGHDFQVEWMCTVRLPFQRTRKIHNPWNHGKQVKVARDGTELEPGVGQALLDEWKR